MPLVVTQTLSPTVDTNAYASGDLVGPKLVFDGLVQGKRSAVGLVIESVAVVDLAKQSANLDLVLFGADPTATTFTDNAALDVADADMPKIVGVVPITRWVAFNDNSVGVLAADTRAALAFGYQANSMRAYIDGAAAGALDTSITVPGAMSTLRLGDATSYWGGQTGCWVERIALFDRRLSDDDLGALTL